MLQADFPGEADRGVALGVVLVAGVDFPALCFSWFGLLDPRILSALKK